MDRQTLVPNELVIVDGSRDKKTDCIIQGRRHTSKYPILYIRSEPNLTIQRNIGILHSSGEYLYFFDDDIVLDSKYLENIQKTFLDDKYLKIGGIAGRIVNFPAANKPVDRIFRKLFYLTDLGRGRIKLSGLPEHRNDSVLSYVNVLSGCCMAYKKEVFVHFRFDENLKGYSYLEDIDFSYRVSQKFGLLYQPLAKCEHFATTFKNANSRTLRRMLVRNHLYLFKKNIPKDICHLYAFGMSLIGLLINNGIMLKDINACIGIIEGLMNPLRTTT